MITLHADIGPFVDCKFVSVCIGPIKRWAQHTAIDNLRYDVPIWTKNEKVRDDYLGQLVAWKFIPRSSLALHVATRNSNIWHWFAGLTVLRYLAEATDFVKWWHKKVYHESYDPWLTFLTGHTVSLMGEHGYGHALVAPSLKTVVNPVRVNEELMTASTGIDFSANLKLHMLYGGSIHMYDPLFKYSGTNVPTEEGFQTHYTRIKTLSETSNSSS